MTDVTTNTAIPTQASLTTNPSGNNNVPSETLQQTTGRQVTLAAFDGALNDIAGLSPSEEENIRNAFAEGFDGSSQITVNPGQYADIVDQVIENANHQGSNGQFTGDLDRIQGELQQIMQQLLSQEIAEEREDAEVGGEGGWLVAIAKAMGSALGQQASEMVTLSHKLDGLAGYSQDDTAAASEFQKTMTEFQATSQLFSMLSSAFSNAIKAIGQGMNSMATKS